MTIHILIFIEILTFHNLSKLSLSLYYYFISYICDFLTVLLYSLKYDFISQLLLFFNLTQKLIFLVLTQA